MSKKGDASPAGFWGQPDSEAALHRSEALVETLDDGLVRLDTDGRVAAVNDVVVERLGYARSEVVGEHVSVLLGEEDAGRLETTVDALADDATADDVVTLDVTVRTAGGDPAARELRVNPVVVDDEHRGTVVVVREDTDQEPSRVRQRERTLLDRVFEASPIGICALGPNGEVITINDRAAEIFGNDPDQPSIEQYEPSEWEMYDEDGERIPPGSRPFGRVVATGERVTDFEAQVERQDGRRVWLSYNAVPVFGADGDLSMVVVTYEDVTQRKEREQQLRREQNQTEKLLQTVPVALSVEDTDGETVLANERAREFLGLSEGEFDDRDDLAGWQLYDEDGTPITREETPTARVRANGEPVFDEEVAVEPPERERLWFRVNAAPIYDADGNLDRVVTAGEDVTELKKRERQLERRKEELETELSEILGRVSDAFFALDEEFCFTHVNDRANELINPEGEALLGENLWEQFPEATERKFETYYRHAMDEQEAVSFEEYYPAPLDTWFEVRAYPSETGLSVYFHDVTERKERERRYRALAENFPNGAVMLFDDDLRYTLVAGQAFDGIDVDVDDVEGNRLDEVWGTETVDTLQSAYEGALAGEERSIEVTYAGRDWLVYVTPITDEVGNVFGGMAMTQDITERKAHEETLAKYETIVETINDGIYVVDEDGRYTMVNDAYTELTGYGREDLLGQHASQFLDEETLEEASAIREEMAQGDVDNPTMEATIETAGGEEVPVEAAFASLPADDRSERVGVVRDITERVEQRRQVEESERRYRTLVENFPNGAVGLFDDDLRYTAVGGQLVEAQGIDPDDRIGSRVHSIYPDELVDEVEPHFRAALDGEASSFETEYHGRYLSAHTLPVGGEDGDGDVDTGMLVVQDITDRKEMEQELRESEAKFRTLAENLEEIVWMSTPDTDEMLYINPMYEMVWGRERETLYENPRSFIDAIHHEDRERVRESYSQLPDEEYDEEFRVVRPDGDVRWVHARGAPVHDEDGNMSRIVGIAEDVTERKERERALEKSERRYRTLAEHFPNGAVGVYDESLQYTLTEGAVLGDNLPESDQLEGRRIPDVYPEETVADLEPLFRAAVDEGETGSTTAEFGGRIWRVWATPLRDADDEIFAGLSFTQDITEQVEREQKLEELVERLEESNERLEQFAYAASHDLQEPLRMVSSYLSLIERRYEDDLDEEAMEFLEFAVDGAERMRGMIDALLKYSRVETRGDPFEPIDLEDIVADAKADLRMKLEETDADVTVESLPKVAGDEEQLRQVFQNLVDNALEYSGDEPPTVHISADRHGDEWHVSVRDEGIGIEPDQTEEVFEVFQRLHTQDEHAGTGIGLALCRRIVERHDGEIWVESEPGEGSTFTFTLPTLEGTHD
ncbi:PAS domain S-box protein [Halospeciosus flavus]|uniref:histidine kinase n=1 Tax=Halospeciosus flavus TaxID=3032283 RepID=A0ABD5Z3U5_9EURY|nr:PAS domain S-box protein [Halospeciosus flavus]